MKRGKGGEESDACFPAWPGLPSCNLAYLPLFPKLGHFRLVVLELLAQLAALVLEPLVVLVVRLAVGLRHDLVGRLGGLRQSDRVVQRDARWNHRSISTP